MSAEYHNFHADFRNLASTTPEATALVDYRDQHSWSYAELADVTARLANLFTKRGMSATRPVMSMLPNSVEAFASFLATLGWRGGFAPLAPDASPQEAVRWAALVKPCLCLVGETTSEKVVSALADAGIAVSVQALDGSFSWLDAGSLNVAPDPGAAKLYLTTSGSTGEPRAMVIDGDRLWSSARAFTAQHGFLDAGSRYFNILPMSYLGGLFNLGLIPLASAGSVVVAPAFSGRSFLSFWQDVERFDVNTLWLVPTIMRGLISIAERTKRNDVPTRAEKVRACFVGTAPIDMTTKERFESLFDIPVLENYGLSETTFLTTETLEGRAHRRDDTVGTILPYVQVALHPAEDTENMHGAAQEVRAQTPFMFDGYLGQDGAISPAVDGSGFLPTGDLGQLAEDGQLVLLGRLRDIVKKGGYLVPLREIETLAEQFPAIEEAIAVGVPHEFYGESYNLLVRLHHDDDPQATLDGFGAWLRENLVRYKWPETIDIAGDVPRTPSGKVRKHLLAQRMAAPMEAAE